MNVSNTEDALEKIELLGGSYVWEPEMFVVNLDQSQVTDEDLALFEFLPSIEVLSLTSTNITDGGLKHLFGLEELQELSLRDTAVTTDGVEALLEALPNLTINRQVRS